MTKYIFVTGGVVSSIGKGIVAASLGRLLKNRGLKVTINLKRFVTKLTFVWGQAINGSGGLMSLELA